jgi:Protein of unknown function (DUF3179)
MRAASRVVRAAVLVALVAALAGCGDGSTDDDLERRLDEAAERTQTIPNVGLGESSLPADADAWKTNFAKRTVPLEEFLPGGPPKDGIPAIDRPRFAATTAIRFLDEREPVIAVTVEDETRGYPIQILIWHEIANDEIAGVPVAVTFCPLCNTALVFDRRVNGKVLDFGTTGKLRDSDLVMYDRQTESWWQQFGGEAVVGDYAGARLRTLAARIVSWREFRSEHPNALVLTRDTGHVRDYGSNPYTGYDDAASPPIFPARGADDDRLQPKERVVYIEIGAEAAAVPYSAFARKRTVRLELGGRMVEVRWRSGVTSALDSPAIADGRDVGAAEVLVNGRPAPFSEPFWFAVAAFRTDVRIVR